MIGSSKIFRQCRLSGCVVLIAISSSKSFRQWSLSGLELPNHLIPIPPSIKPNNIAKIKLTAWIEKLFESSINSPIYFMFPQFKESTQFSSKKVLPFACYNNQTKCLTAMRWPTVSRFNAGCVAGQGFDITQNEKRLFHLDVLNVHNRLRFWYRFGGNGNTTYIAADRFINRPQGTSSATKLIGSWLKLNCIVDLLQRIVFFSIRVL